MAALANLIYGGDDKNAELMALNEILRYGGDDFFDEKLEKSFLKGDDAPSTSSESSDETSDNDEIEMNSKLNSRVECDVTKFCNECPKICDDIIEDGDIMNLDDLMKNKSSKNNSFKSELAKRAKQINNKKSANKSPKNNSFKSELAKKAKQINGGGAKRKNNICSQQVSESLKKFTDEIKL